MRDTLSRPSPAIVRGVVDESAETERSDNGKVIAEHFVDAYAVSEHLSLTRRQVLEMPRRQIIPAYPLGTGQRRKIWRFKISEVETAIASEIGKSKLPNDSGLAKKPVQRTIPVGSPQGQKGKL